MKGFIFEEETQALPETADKQVASQSTSVQVLPEDIEALKKVLEESNVAGLDFYELSNAQEKTNDWATALDLLRDMSIMLKDDAHVDQSILESFDTYFTAIETYKNNVKAKAQQQLEAAVGEESKRFSKCSARLEEINKQLILLQEEKDRIETELPELESKIVAAKQVAKNRMDQFILAYTKVRTYLETCKNIVTPLLRIE